MTLLEVSIKGVLKGSGAVKNHLSDVHSAFLKDFFQFVSMPYGYRALIKTLQNYRKLHDCWTIGDFIRRYAPPTENHTTAYIRTVCDKMGVPPAYIPNTDDKLTMCMLAAAISYVENGVLAEMEDVVKGWELL